MAFLRVAHHVSTNDVKNQGFVNHFPQETMVFHVYGHKHPRGNNEKNVIFHCAKSLYMWVLELIHCYAWLPEGNII